MTMIRLGCHGILKARTTSTDLVISDTIDAAIRHTLRQFGDATIRQIGHAWPREMNTGLTTYDVDESNNKVIMKLRLKDIILKPENYGKG